MTEWQNMICMPDKAGGPHRVDLSLCSKVGSDALRGLAHEPASFIVTSQLLIQLRPVPAAARDRLLKRHSSLNRSLLQFFPGFLTPGRLRRAQCGRPPAVVMPEVSARAESLAPTTM